MYRIAVVSDPCRNSAAYIHPSLPLASQSRQGWKSRNSLPMIFHCQNQGTWYRLESNKALSPLLANICRQWFQLFIQVSSTTTVPLQGAVPHCQLHHLYYCQFKYLFIVLGHQWGQNDWKSSKVSQQNTLYPSTSEPPRKIFCFGKAIRGSILYFGVNYFKQF